MSFQQPLQIVTQAVNLLGHEHINPESLMALGDAIERDEVGADVRRAYRTVMAGFRALFAPVEAA